MIFSIKLKGKKNYFYKLFFGFLLFHSFLFLVGVKMGFIPDFCYGDECRYFENVFNIFNGTYQDPLKDRLVTPMHSLYIAPIVLLDLGRRAVVFLNLIVSSLTISFTYLTSRFYLSNRLSLCLSIIYGFYYIKYEQDFTAFTETFTTFLVLSNFYLITKYKLTQKKYYLFSAGIVLGILCLERPIFFYVLLSFILLFFIILIWNRKYLNFLLSLILSFSITIPYQIFTFNATGKLFFLSNLGGETLYWMSNPNKGEYGDWQNEDFDANCQLAQESIGLSNISSIVSSSTKGINCNSQFFENNHGEFFKSIENLNMIEKDQALFQKGIQNIKSKPTKYFRNVISNVSRLFFNFPGSYMYEREITIFRIIPNSIILNLIIFSILITIKNIKKMPREMLYGVFFTFLYLALSSSITAYARMFVVVVPYLLIWAFYSIKTWKNS